MLKEARRLELEIQATEEIIKKLPEGKFVCCHGKNCYKWYQSDGHTKTYIRKEDRELAENLMYKKYLQAHIQDLTCEKEAVELYINHINQVISKANQLMAKSPEFQKLLSPFFKPEKDVLTAWMNESYEKNPKYLRGLVVKTCTGEYVRSKSETYIYTALHNHKIPFRYECRLVVGEKVFYPDFTIRHPKTGDFFYWEHHGLMDKPGYAKKSYEKLEDYYSVHIIPGINLITTYETDEHPLSFDLVEKIISYYFL